MDRQARQGESGNDETARGRRVASCRSLARNGEARHGSERLARIGLAWRGLEGSGKAWPGWIGLAEPGEDWRGEATRPLARLAWTWFVSGRLGWAATCVARLAWRVANSPGEVRMGETRLRMARHGMAG